MLEHPAAGIGKSYWELEVFFSQIGALNMLRETNDYKISVGYKLLMGEDIRERRFNQVWNPLTIPKHSFILWLILHGRLMTKSRVSRFTSLADVGCSFCAKEEETSQHLFFKCEVVQEWLKEIKNWLGWRTYKVDLMPLLEWINRQKILKFQRRTGVAAVAALIYAVWYQRNRIVWHHENPQQSEVCRKVKYDVKMRVKARGTSNISVEDIRWFVEL